MATNNPLVIAIDSEWFDRPEIKALQEAGHTIILSQPGDLTLSSRAWNWSDSHWPYLDIALKAARKDKPKGIKKDGKQRKLGRGTDRNGVGKTGRRRRTVRDNNLQAASGESPNDKA